MNAESDGGNGSAILRDESGRFLPGTAGGPGSGRGRRIAAFREVIRMACRPEDVASVVAMLLRRALEGDTGAARELLDRVVGRPQRESEPVSFDVVEVSDVASAAKAASALVGALARGDVDADTAFRFAGVLGVSLKALELSEIGARLAALEQRLNEGVPR